jgi:hypothetical protein
MGLVILSGPRIGPKGDQRTPERRKAVLATYVHAPGVPNIWHWCKNCSDYPSNAAGHTSVRPTGQLCDQCRAKERDGNCWS